MKCVALAAPIRLFYHKGKDETDAPSIDRNFLRVGFSRHSRQGHVTPLHNAFQTKQLNLTKREMQLRSIARERQMPLPDVEMAYAAFESANEDGSGSLDRPD